jgi:hypothetical protein
VYRHLHRHRATEAETDDAGPTVHLLDRAERVERSESIGRCLLFVDVLDEFERSGQPGFVMVGFPVPLLPPEHVGRTDHITELGQAFTHGPDVRADAEDLLDEDQAGTVAGIGHPEVQVERTVGNVRGLGAGAGHLRLLSGSGCASARDHHDPNIMSHWSRFCGRNTTLRFLVSAIVADGFSE